MYWRISSIVLLFVLSACKREKTIEAEKNSPIEESSKTSYLIEVDELKNMVNQPNIKLLDFRKKEAYDKDHINGALHIWRIDIEDKSYPYKGIMASKGQIETLFSNLGITNKDTLIIYDDNGLCNASRLWWILQNYDFDNIKLFHGGLDAWKANKGSVSTEIPSVKKSTFKLTETPSMKYYVSKEDILVALHNTDNVIIDTRTVDEFSGKRQKKGAYKGGRIPNSKLIDWAVAINYNGDKKIKDLEALEIVYSQLNDAKEQSIILYCHSGVRSAHTTFILTQLLDYKNVKNYDGSWTEWSYFEGLPFEKDSLTTIKK